MCVREIERERERVCVAVLANELMCVRFQDIEKLCLCECQSFQCMSASECVCQIECVCVYKCKRMCTYVRLNVCVCVCKHVCVKRERVSVCNRNFF